MSTRIIPLTSGPAPSFAWRMPQAVAAVKNEKMPAGQWKTLLRSLMNKGQFKLTEIEDSNIDAWLDERDGAGKPSIRREELVEAMSFALPSIKEVQKREGDAGYIRWTWHDALIAADNYVESIFYFPTVKEDFDDRIAELDDLISSYNFNYELLAEDPSAVLRLDEKRATYLKKQATSSHGQGIGTHFSSFLQQLTPDAQADFAHMRWSTCMMNGVKTLFIHEMQSDWAQDGRAVATRARDRREMETRRFVEAAAAAIQEPDVREAAIEAALNEFRAAYITKTGAGPYDDWTGVYKAGPLVRETEMWAGFLMRRATQLAMQNGCDQLTWINGQAMTNGGIAANAREGITQFYQGLAGRLAQKIAKPFHAKVELVEVVLRNKAYKLAVMEINGAMRDGLHAKQQVYSRARVTQAAGFNPARAEALRSFLQKRCDSMTAGEMRCVVVVVDEILTAHDEERAAGELVGNVVRVAFQEGDDPVEALDHEAFHFVLRNQFEPAERSAVLDRFQPGSPMQLRIAGALLKDGHIEAAAQTSQSAEEAAAHAFAYWNKGSFRLADSDERTRGLRAIFISVRRAIESVTQWIRANASSPHDFAARIVGAADAANREDSGRRDSESPEDEAPQRRVAALA